MAVRFLSSENIDGSLQIGSGHNTASAGNAVIFAPYGSGTNIAGGDMQIYGGRSTGSAAGGSIKFYTSNAGTSGSGVNAHSLALTIDSSQNATFSGNIGIGGTPGQNLDIQKSGARIRMIDGTNQFNMGLWDGSNYRFEGDANRPMFFTSYQGNINFGISGGLQMTVDSAGVNSQGDVRVSGGVTRIISNQIQAGYNQNIDNTDIWINYTGYQGSTTYFRDFRVGNGKTGLIAMFDGSSGNVGIGAAPANKLHIQQAKSGSSSENYDLLRFNLTGTGAIGDSSSIVWYSTSGTKTAGIEGVSGQDNILYGEIAFNVRKYTTDSFDEAMRINNRGNVGISTDSPTNLLDIKSNGSSKGLDIHHSNGNIVAQLIHGGSGDEGQLKLYDSNVETVRISGEFGVDSFINSGQVGIGTDSPARGPLHVHESSTGYSQVHLTNSSSGSTSNDGLTLFTNGNDAGLMQRENSYLLFGTNDTERMRITSNGEIYNSGSTSANGYNTFYGSQALFSRTSGVRNTAFGSLALDALTTGNYNTAIGWGNQSATTAAEYNTSVGYDTLTNVSTGGNNTALGAVAGVNITTGADNTLVGSEAGKNLTSGQQNIAIGKESLLSATSAQTNTAIGYAALYSCTANDNVAIGYLAGQDVSTGTLNTILGNYAGRNVTTASYGTFIGRTAGNAHTTGAEPFYVGYDAGQQVTTGNYNTAIGTSAMTYGNGTKNCFVGFHSGFGANGHTGNYNTALGADSLESINGGDYNTAVGRAAGSDVTSSDYNTFVGGISGLSVTTGENNTFLGAISGRYCTTGSRNTIVGSQAMDNNTMTGNNNVAVGFTAGQDFTTQTDTTIVGSFAGSNLTTGEGQVVIGNGAMQNSTTASGNIAVGKHALRNCTTGGSNIAIGYSAAEGGTVTGTHNLVIGDAAGYNLSSGGNNILIGRNAGRTGSQTPQSLGAVTTNSNEIQMGNGSHTGAFIQIGWTTVSDARDKGQIQDVPHGLDFVNQLQPKSFEFKPDREAEETDGIKRYGFLAQDVLELEGENPVVVNKNDEDKLKMTNDYLVPILVNAIKELKAEIDTLKSQIQ